jgi:hypothetical protein
MNATAAALLGSLIGALAALAGAAFSSFVALRNERRREESKVHAAYVRALRKRSGAAFAQFFAIVQEIEWITWYGTNDPAAINKDRINLYEDAVNNAYKSLLGSMAMTASLNLPAYDEMRPILTKLYDLEARVGRAIRRVGSDHHSAAIQELITYGSETATLRDELPPELYRIMTLAETVGKGRD